MSDTFAEPQVAAPMEAAPEEVPVEPVWEGPTQEAWEQQQAELAYFREQQAQAQQPEPDYSQFDPFSEAFPQQLAQIAERLDQIQGYVSQAQASEGRELLLDVIQDDISRNGEFLMGEDASNLIINAARELMPAMTQRYGHGDRAAQEAIYKAAADHREREQRWRQAVIDQHTNQLSTLAGAPREPGVGAFPAGQVQQGARDIDELLAKYTGG